MVEKRRIIIMKILGHVILTFLTGGLWLVYLLIKFLVKNS